VAPFWKGEGIGRPAELGERIGKATREIVASSDDNASRLLTSAYNLDQRAARNLVVFLREQERATGVVPSDRTVVVERFRDEIGDWRVCILTPFGGRVHAPWAMALGARLRDTLDVDAQSLWSDDGIALHFPDADVPPPVADLLLDPAANTEWCGFLAEKITGIVHDPETARKLIPKDHRFGEHRPPFVTGYYEAYNRPNVTLVDVKETPIVRVTPNGIETTEGERELDVIVWATGFDFGTGALLRMGIRGRDGVPLEQHWADGPRTFLGVQTSGFPSLFFPGGPHAAAGNNPRYNGDQVDFVTDTLIYVREHGFDAIEVDPAAEEEWTSMVDRNAAKPPSFGASSYYFGSNIPGKPRRYLLNSAGRPKLFKEIARVVESDYEGFLLSRSSETLASSS